VEHALGLDVRWADLFSIDLARLGLTMPRRDDRDAEFEAFFVEHYDAIAQSVAFVCGDAQRADDATQEAFIKAYARWNKVRRYDNVGAWIRRIAINASRDAHRADTRRTRREERALAQASNETSDVGGSDSTLRLLETLPERQRAIAALYYLDEMPVPDIAAVLGIAEGTVRFHLSEARNRLREHLDRRHDRAH
jgi:RNA polymerase sigma-70 factor (ECF subfamily)